MFPKIIDQELTLDLLRGDDADVMFDLIARNREHLDRWLRWSARIQSVDDARAYIQRFAARYEAGEGFHAGLWYTGRFVGGVACRDINRESSNAEIGYWLGAEFTGKGWVTRACRVVIDDLFARDKLHRIEIQAAADNGPSRAVAERLGFTFEGIKRESEWITSSFRDHALYSLLDREWQSPP